MKKEDMSLLVMHVTFGSMFKHHHGINGFRYGFDFLSRLKFMNVPPGAKRIHSLFPMTQFKRPIYRSCRCYQEAKGSLCTSRSSRWMQKVILVVWYGGIRKTQICLKFVEEMAGR